MEIYTSPMSKLLLITSREEPRINFIPSSTWINMTTPEKLFVLSINLEMLRSEELSFQKVLQAIRSYLYTRNLDNKIQSLLKRKILIKRGDKYISPISQDVYILGTPRRGKYNSLIKRILKGRTLTLRELIEELTNRSKIEKTNTYKVIYNAVISGIVTPTIEGLTLSLSQ